MSQNQSFVPQHLAIESLRDNGFRNAAYAIAELIDNSIQAEANSVQLICAEERISYQYKSMPNVIQIAILDNGCGMAPELLQRAIQFGDGDNRRNPNGMGRFGMGLPASSVSQCRYVEVWSWQNGIENAHYTYLDIDAIRSGTLQGVPTPIKKPIPSVWVNIGSNDGDNFKERGTLVLWSNLDRLVWKKASTIFEKSESIFGRMYRKFLNNSTVRIRMVSFEWAGQEPIDVKSKYALPNDPLYLMSPSTCPAPYHNTPMFRKPSEVIDRQFPVKYKGSEHIIDVRYSYAKDSARKSPDGKNAGHLDYGKHAAANIGISILRAGRELELDRNMVNNEPMERWWGVEVEFSPALDELMGVVNNKQSAVNLTEAFKTMGKDSDSYDGGKSYNDYITELEEIGDPQYFLIKLATEIKNNLRALRDMIKAQMPKSTGNEKRHSEELLQIISEETNKRSEKGKSDQAEDQPVNENTEAIFSDLSELGIQREAIESEVREAIDQKFKYIFVRHNTDSSAFFSVRNSGGKLTIVLNSTHKAFQYLVETLDESTSGQSVSELQARLSKASDGLKILLMAWARFEDELPDGTRRDEARVTRNDWGRIADSFLREYDNKISD